MIILQILPTKVIWNIEPKNKLTVKTVRIVKNVNSCNGHQNKWVINKY